MSSLRSYAVVTAAYWGFTLTDGALRMLVVLYFHQLGYGALAIATLFLFYEFFGVVTNLVGGYIAARFGLNTTLFSGLALQVLTLYGLSLEQQLSVPYVMALQALSGIAKDLNKMSAKSSLKLLIPTDAQGQLFKWVALLTGSKNALKGVGFFLGGLLLTLYGYRHALLGMAGSLALIGLISVTLLPRQLQGKTAGLKFRQIFSTSRAVNGLSAARFFLFAARDVWFVVALPVFLQAQLGWSFTQVGGLLAGWVILYGLVQSSSPQLLGMRQRSGAPNAALAVRAALILFIVPLAMLLATYFQLPMNWVVIGGLLLFAVVFAVNSAVHSYLILAFSQQDRVSLDVGFYYMSNAAGRLLGTLLSGVLYQYWGIQACLLGSALLIAACTLLSNRLND